MPIIQVNIGDHASPIPGYGSFPRMRRPMISWARLEAIRIARDMPSADTYFQSLPLSQKLSDLLQNNRIWINYSAVMPHYGETNRVGGKEVCISEYAHRWGKWTVLATLIHELAHVNGAPGGADKRAEEALLHCGLGKGSEKTSGVDDVVTPYQPGIGG